MTLWSRVSAPLLFSECNGVQKVSQPDVACVAPVMWVPSDLCREGAKVQWDRHVSETIRFGDHRRYARRDRGDASDAGDCRGCRQEVRDDHRGVAAQARVGR